MTTETDIQQLIRLDAPTQGCALWRNNNGACRDDKGRMIRYGLANDSKKINEFFKSSDLIGPTSIRIEPHHVGSIMAIFTAVEVKRDGFVYNPNDKRQLGQHNFHEFVLRMGGYAGFADSVETFRRIIGR